ncbi:MAG: zinc chelation protein SecC [Curvibacter sp.]|nr:MAG: zinc chelation protein SecC [Curvibacter sp.]
MSSDSQADTPNEVAASPALVYPVPGERLPPEAFDELDAILDDLRSREDEIPQWEFCEGFMAAVICSRRPLPPAEYLPMLLGDGITADETDAQGIPNLTAFADPAQQARFISLWQARWNEVQTALDTKVDSLGDERCYEPEVMDMRGAMATLSEEELAELGDQEVPSFGQIWALGFMFAVENWPEEWAAPRDKEAAEWLDDALNRIVALTEDDTGKPELSMFAEDGPPSLSQARLDAFGDAIWAVYDLRQLWKSFGPRVETIRKEAGPGRNDPCPCGSGKKFKKCHGA